MATISVIIPTRNRSQFLRCAIASVLSQTIQDWEIIVVDDASEDNTQEVVKSFGDQRIKYICHETNRGVATARNTGILNSSGKYIAFLDDDDEWFPEKLDLQFNLLERSPVIVGGVYTGSLAVEGRSRKVIAKYTATKRGHIFNEMLIDNSIAPTSAFFLRRECFEKVGLFDDNLDFSEDFDMWLRIAKEFQFECIREPLVRFSVHNSDPSLSTNYGMMIKGKENYIEKCTVLYKLDRKIISSHYLEIGTLYCYNGSMDKGRKAFIKAIITYPFNIRYYFNLFLSLLGIKNFSRLKMLRDQWLP